MARYCFVLHLSISTALLTARAFQKRPQLQQLTPCRSLHAEAPQATASEGLAQGPYVAASAGFEPAKGIDSTNAPPRPTQRYPPSRTIIRTLQRPTTLRVF